MTPDTAVELVRASQDQHVARGAEYSLAMLQTQLLLKAGVDAATLARVLWGDEG